jgi:hypothetical protein
MQGKDNQRSEKSDNCVGQQKKQGECIFLDAHDGPGIDIGAVLGGISNQFRGVTKPLPPRHHVPKSDRIFHDPGTFRLPWAEQSISCASSLLSTLRLHLPTPCPAEHHGHSARLSLTPPF